ncbi:MAG: hypothetical protein ING19_13445 [Azospirillum sp.]|nr:hypothetical protein [Azospirillum sp.]
MTAILLEAPAKTAASGQYLGFSLQAVRLCHHLLKAPDGSSVSIEYLDDTAIHYPDGAVLLEQSKSALSTNPVSDRSSGLWKTFANWAQLCIEKGPDLNITRFRLYLCPPKTVGVVEELHAAKTVDQAKSVLKKINKMAAAAAQRRSSNPHITQFLKAGEDVCLQIILKFEFVSEIDPLEPIREMLRVSVPDESLEQFCAAAIGAAKNQTDALIRDNKVAILEANKFRKIHQAFIRKHNILSLLNSTTSQPSEDNVLGTINASPIFVQQLNCIGLSKERVVRAVSDFLRSNADRVNWAASGHIVEANLDELNDSLERQFQIIRDEVEDINTHLDEDKRGRLVYGKCLAHQAQLAGNTLPAYFIPGTYNLLADMVRLGWHPKYKDLFSG